MRQQASGHISSKARSRLSILASEISLFPGLGHFSSAYRKDQYEPARAGYSADLMAWSSWKRIAPLLLRNEITKRTCPFVVVLA